MKPDANCLRIPPCELNRERLDQHVERGFRGSVGVPPTQSIVFDAAHAGRQRGKNCLPVLGKQRQKMLGNESRSDCVYLEGGVHRGRG